MVESHNAKSAAALGTQEVDGIRTDAGVQPPVPNPHRSHRGLWGLALALALLALVGCRGGNECELGQVRCKGNAAEYCERASSDDDTWTWHSQDCGEGFCKLSADSELNHPFCAASDAPDPRCSQGQYYELCDENRLIGCHQGYVEHSTDCTTGTSFGPPYRISEMPKGYCVEKEGAAMCALSSEPNPACPTDTVVTASTTPWREACSGNQLLNCFYEWVVIIEDCPAGGTCVPHEYPFCAMFSESEPQCPTEAAVASFCRDGVIEHCRYGWIEREESCDGANQCSMTATGTAICSAK